MTNINLFYYKMENPIYFKITNYEENNKTHKYVDGLNIIDEIFESQFSKTSNYASFTTISNITNFYSQGCNLREVYFPLDDNYFQLGSSQNGDKLCVNMIQLGNKYSLLDESTYIKFNLPIPSVHELVKIACRNGITDFLYKKNSQILHFLNKCIPEYIELACEYGQINVLTWFRNITPASIYNKNIISILCKNGHVHILNWCKFNSLKLQYDNKAINYACAYGHIEILDWWLKSGFEIKYDGSAITNASKNGHIGVLDWWLKSGLEIKYDETAITDASKNGHINVLDWWLNSGLKIIYNYNVINIASMYCQFAILDWWKKSSLKIEYGIEILAHASAYGHTDVLNWWKKSGLELKYDCSAISEASRSGHINVLEWWVESGLELKYNKFAIELASSYGNINVLDWWVKSGLILIYDRYAVNSASIWGHINVLDWWKKSHIELNLELKYGSDTKYHNDGTNTTYVFLNINQEKVLKWWDESGLPYKLKYMFYSDDYHKDLFLVKKKYMCCDLCDSINPNKNCEIDDSRFIYLAKIACERGSVIFLEKHKNKIKYLFETNAITKIYEHLVRLACSNGHHNILEWWKQSGLNFCYDNKSTNCASENGHTNVLQWWKKSGYCIIYDCDAINNASKNNHMNTLEWWKKSGLKIIYDSKALEFASMNGHIRILEWWKKSGLKMIYDDRVIDYANKDRYFDILNWWKNSGLPLKYSKNSITFASMDDRIDILDWWLKSGLVMIYDEDAINLASIYKKINSLNWWLNSGLKLKYNINAIHEHYNISEQTIEWWINSALRLDENMWRLIMSRLTPSYLKITNETDRTHQYITGLNISCTIFDKNKSYAKNELCYSKKENIHQFYHLGTNIREVYLPTKSSGFFSTKNKTQDNYWANKIILGPKYSLLDPYTYQKFKLKSSQYCNIFSNKTPFYLISCHENNGIIIQNSAQYQSSPIVCKNKKEKNKSRVFRTFDVERNIWEIPFQPKHFYVHGGVYFTTHKHICDFYQKDCYLQQIYLPVTNSDFQIIKYPTQDICWANMFTLGPKYTLHEIKKYLEININSKSYPNLYFCSNPDSQYVISYFIICKIDQYQQIKYVDNMNIIDKMSKYTNKNVPNKLYFVTQNDMYKYINKNCHIDKHIHEVFLSTKNKNFNLTVDLSREKYCANILTLGEKYEIFDIRTQNKFGFSKNVLTFIHIMTKYQNMNIASATNNIELLNWWLNSGLELVYDRSTIKYASLYGYVDVLRWWMNSGLKIKDSDPFLNILKHF